MDFCDTLAEILKKAKREQLRQRFQYGELYYRNYYKQVTDKGRTYYEVYTLQNTEDVPEDYTEISFACLRPDGAIEYPNTVGLVCRSVRKKVKGLEDFHFHVLRHTYTSNGLPQGS